MEYDIKAMLGTYYIWTMFACITQDSVPQESNKQ
jgi:hypothetical protein